jgi:hypothetical protein
MGAVSDRDEFEKRRRGRNLALALALAGAALLFYVLTFVRMGGGE